MDGQQEDPFEPLEDDRAGEYGYIKDQTYWALWKGRDLVDALEKKKRDWYEAARNRGLIDRWTIAYAFHHGATPEDLRELATMVVSFTGSELERVRMHINLVRSYARSAAIIALGEKPAFKCKTINNDHRSLAQAELSDKLVGGLYSRYYEEHDPEVAEGDGFAGAAGTHTLWDFKGGDDVEIDVPVMRQKLDEFGEPVLAADGEPVLEPDMTEPQPQVDENGELMFDEQGNVMMTEPEPITHPKMIKTGAPDVSVVYPWAVYGETRAPGSELWRCIRVRGNKWNLIGQYGAKFREAIIKLDHKLDEYDFATLFRLEGLEIQNDDMLVVEHFYHARCPAIPEGRYVVKCGDVILWDGPCPTKEGIPYSEMRSSRFVETEFPYCDGWDLISMNMALNQCVSDELQNLSLFSRQSTYSYKGSNVTSNAITRGVHWELPPDAKPPGSIMFAQLPPTDPFKTFLLGMADRITGMNGTSRGDPEANVRSGEMAALLDSMTVRYQSFRQQAAKRYRVRNAQIALDMITRYGETKFFVDVAGVEDRVFVREFTRDDLQGIQRVDIELDSPLMQTMSGRMQWFLSLQKLPAQERAAAHDFVVSGDPDAFMGRDRSAEQLVRRENEKMILGSEEIEVNATDNPWLHVPKHVAAVERLLASDEPDLEAVKRLRTHILQHWSVWTMYAQPLVCRFLGIPEPPPIGPTPDAPMGNAAFQFQQQTGGAMALNPVAVEPGDSANEGGPNDTTPNGPAQPGEPERPQPEQPSPTGAPGAHSSGVSLPEASTPP